MPKSGSVEKIPNNPDSFKRIAAVIVASLSILPVGAVFNTLKFGTYDPTQLACQILNEINQTDLSAALNRLVSEAPRSGIVFNSSIEGSDNFSPLETLPQLDTQEIQRVISLGKSYKLMWQNYKYPDNFARVDFNDPYLGEVSIQYAMSDIRILIKQDGEIYSVENTPEGYKLISRGNCKDMDTES